MIIRNVFWIGINECVFIFYLIENDWFFVVDLLFGYEIGNFDDIVGCGVSFSVVDSFW